MRKNLLFTLIVLTISSQLFSQSASKALKLLEAGNFPAAIEMYEKLIEKDPNEAKYHM